MVDFPIVGLGASAGGLQALTGFFDHMPADSGMAFVVLQHFGPSHKSELANLLQPHTSMVVTVAKDRLKIAPNHIYVASPDSELTVDSGFLRAKPFADVKDSHYCIDTFLRSLAQAAGTWSAGVVLSGTGSDGTLGLKEIQAEGGLAITQHPSEALHDGMPRHAIAAGAVDLVLALHEIPGALAGSFGRRGAGRDTLDHRQLRQILDFLKSNAGVDFAPYKEGVLQRRIERRMAINHSASPDDYLTILQETNTESKLLVQDMLIGVTSFFRDEAAYGGLQQTVLPELLEGAERNVSLRLWVPGCSTGEEAYSLAMLVMEAAEKAGKSLKLRIFATDINEEALEIARQGTYPDSIRGHVSAARLERFFLPFNHSFLVRPEIREKVLFARQNVLSEPPFANIDLISCRNLLIYLKQEAQDRLILLYHYVLSQNGYLVLGSSESIGKNSDRFRQVGPAGGVFQRIGARGTAELAFTSPSPRTKHAGVTRASQPTSRSQADRFEELMTETLLAHETPAAVLVDQHLMVQYTNGPVDRFLRVPVGGVGQDLLAMAREGLRRPLRGLVQRALAAKESVPVTASGVRSVDGKQPTVVTMKGRRIDVREGETPTLVLLTFQDNRAEVPPEPVRQGNDNATMHALEQELTQTRKDLENTIEDLNLANEEAMSINEELRVSNEELETSKEEQQALIEELSAVNNELEITAEQQRRTVTHLNNLLSGTNVALIFLDKTKCIEFFTPSAADLFSIISSDMGRPLADLRQRFEDPTLTEDIDNVLGGGETAKREIQAHDGRWYNRLVMPYRTVSESGDGVVLTFADITEVKTAEQHRTPGFLQSVFDTVRSPLLVLDSGLRVYSASPSFCRQFATNLESLQGRNLFEIADRQFESAALRDLLETTLNESWPDASAAEDVEITLNDDAPRTFLVNVRCLAGERDSPMILLAMEDVTERRIAEKV